MSIKKATITVGTKDEPLFTFMLGHVDLKTFNEAAKNEGWDSEEMATKETMIHGFYSRNKKPSKKYVYKFSKELTKEICEPCTYIEW